MSIQLFDGVPTSLVGQTDGGGAVFVLNWIENEVLKLESGVTIVSASSEQADVSVVNLDYITYRSNGYEGTDTLTLTLSDGTTTNLTVRSLSESDSTIDVSGRRLNDDQFGSGSYSNGNRYTINAVPYYDGQTVVRITEQELLEGIVNENGTTEGLEVTLNSSYVQDFDNYTPFDITYSESEKAYYISNIDLTGQDGNTVNDAFLVNFTVTDTTNGYESLNFTSVIDRGGVAPEGYVQPELPLPDPEITLLVEQQGGRAFGEGTLLNYLGIDPSSGISISGYSNVENGRISSFGSEETAFVPDRTFEGVEQVTVNLSDGTSREIAFYVVSDSNETISSIERRRQDLFVFNEDFPAGGGRYSYGTQIRGYEGSKVVTWREDELTFGITQADGSTDGLEVEFLGARVWVGSRSNYTKVEVDYNAATKTYSATIPDNALVTSSGATVLLTDVEITDTTNSESNPFIVTNWTKFLDAPEGSILADDPNLRNFLIENGAGYYTFESGYLVPVDVSGITDESELLGIYYCDPATGDLNAQFMDPTTGDVAPNFGETTPPAPGTYPSGTLFEELCTCVDELPAFQDPFEGYDPLNNWKPQRRLEINPGGPAAEPLGDELVINDANGRLFGINNRASDSTFDDITGVAFVMGAEGSFDDGSIAGDEYVGTLEFDLKEGYRTTANFNSAQLSPIEGFISADGTLDGALVDTENGEVLALFESVEVL